MLKYFGGALLVLFAACNATASHMFPLTEVTNPIASSLSEVTPYQIESQFHNYLDSFIASRVSVFLPSPVLNTINAYFLQYF